MIIHPNHHPDNDLYPLPREPRSSRVLPLLRHPINLAVSRWDDICGKIQCYRGFAACAAKPLLL